MADAAVTFLLDNVRKLLMGHVNLIGGAKTELKQLQNELELMQAFLEESANKREKGQVFEQFERQIRDVVLKAEDTLEACLTQLPKKRACSLLKYVSPKRHNLALQIKALREDEVQPIFDRARMGFSMLPMAHASSARPYRTTSQDKRPTPFLRQDNVVGFEDEAETIIKYLKEESMQVEVISIIGMPGLGKTTLAWKIHRDPRVQYEFPIIIWVYVSNDFNIREVFLTILKKFTHHDMSTMPDHDLAQQVRSHLEKPKFLLFLDDVWTTETWDLIERALPMNNKLGKIVITSRDHKVGRKANRRREPHKLRFLDGDESWELLQLEVFGKLDECPPEMEVLGRDIAKQCGGVPLAVVVIGGILVEKFSTSSDMKNEWEKVSTRVSTYFAYDKQKRTEKFISLSYNQLPNELRDCFIYLGMFPEDSEIPAWKLIRLWIAEGFIRQKAEKSLEEVAEENLNDLVARNLVMVDRITAKGDVKSCRVHDMIREFCKSQAEFAKQNMFQEVRKTRDGVFHPPVSELQNYRRLSTHTYVVDFLRKRPRGPLVRSFLCFSKEAIILPPELTQSIFEAFSLLRVLDATPLKFAKFPTKLTQIINLRYIAISGDSFKVLPEAISKLWNLQTIRVDTMSRTFEIKANIWKMKQLRHLKTKAAIVLSIEDQKYEGGENLQTLSRLMADCCTDDVFARASNLKNLGIRGRLDKLSEARFLEKFDRLHKLKLVYDVHPNVTSENPLSSLPQPQRFPPNLRILTLSSTFLEWKHMSTLGKLQGLEVLKLKENAFMGRVWESVTGDFPSLECLYIARTDLQFWTADGHPFPKLRCLVLKNCEKLQEIPLVLWRSLQVLDVERVTKSVVASARKIKAKKDGMQDQQRGEFKLIISPGDG